MKRRTFVSILALSAISGCISSNVANSSSGHEEYQVKHFNCDVTYPREDTSKLHFDSTVIEETITPSNPGVFRFSFSNEADYSLRISSGVIPPFGIPVARKGNADIGVELWRDEYEQNPNVQVQNGEVVGQTKPAITTSIGPKETVMKDYSLRTQTAFSAGEYVVEDKVTFYNYNHEKRGILKYRISFTVRSK